MLLLLVLYILCRLYCAVFNCFSCLFMLLALKPLSLSKSDELCILTTGWIRCADSVYHRAAT